MKIGFLFKKISLVLMALALLCPALLLMLFVAGLVSGVISGFMSEPTYRVPVDKVLPENEGRLVRVHGYLESNETLEIPEWGICLPALFAAVGEGCYWRAGSEWVEAARISIGAFQLDNKEYQITPGLARMIYQLPMPREQVKTLPQGLQNARWSTERTEWGRHEWEKDQSLVLRGVVEFEPVEMHFVYCPPRSPEPVYLMGRQRGHTLTELVFYDDNALAWYLSGFKSFRLAFINQDDNWLYFALPLCSLLSFAGLCAVMRKLFALNISWVSGILIYVWGLGVGMLLWTAFPELSFGIPNYLRGGYRVLFIAPTLIALPCYWYVRWRLRNK